MSAIDTLRQKAEADPIMMPLVRARMAALDTSPLSPDEERFAEMLAIALSNARDHTGKLNPIAFRFDQLPSAARSLLDMMKSVNEGTW